MSHSKSSKRTSSLSLSLQVLDLTKLIDDEDEDTLENIDNDSDNEDVFLEDLEWDSFDTNNTIKK